MAVLQQLGVKLRVNLIGEMGGVTASRRVELVSLGSVVVRGPLWSLFISPVSLSLSTNELVRG